MFIREILQELQPDLLPGSAALRPEQPVIQVEFYRYLTQRSGNYAYMADAAELDTLEFPDADSVQIILFVACRDGAVPAFRFPGCVSAVYVKRSLQALTRTLITALRRDQSRRDIRTVFEMGQKANLGFTDLIRSACQALSIGVCIYDPAADEILAEDCADSLCSALSLDPQEKKSVFDIMGAVLRRMFRADTAKLYEGCLCFEACSARLNSKYTHRAVRLVVFYDANASFDFQLLVRLALDYFSRNKGALTQAKAESTIGQILDGTLRDYPAVADILFGADQEQKGFRLLQICPADKALVWRQWASAVRALLRCAFCQVHFYDDGEIITAIPIAKYGSFRGAGETKNSAEPLWYYQEGWNEEKLRAELLRGGADCLLSPVTSSMDTIENLHFQTKLTLDIARKVEKDGEPAHFWYHADIVPYLPMYYGLKLYRGQYPAPKSAGLWIHPEIFRLLRNDLAERKDLAPVLYTYLLSGMDVGAVSKKLYMHRNTVYSRLKSIEAFTGKTLKDAIYYNSFLPSLRLYFFCRYYLNMDANELLLVEQRDSFTDEFPTPVP